MPVQKPTCQNSTSGVSEVVGAVLLVSLVVLAVSIIGMILFSQSTPQKIPNINFMTGSDSNGDIYLYHNGGDSLTKGTFDVIIDNKVAIPTFPNGGNTWSLGQNLIITSGFDKTLPRHNIILAYNSSGTGPVVLRSGSSSLMDNSSARTADVIRISSYPPVVSVPQLIQNVSSGTIIFYREKNTAISQSPATSFNFTVTMPNSTIYTSPPCGANPYTIAPNSTVLITQKDSVTQGFRVSGIGNQIWELSADNVDILISDATGTVQCSRSNAIINHTLITGYKNFHSNFTVGTGSSVVSSFTALTKYNYSVSTPPQDTSQIIRGFDNTPIVIYDISPASAGFFAFYFDNATKSMYFAGNTTKVTRNSIQIYP
jgi:hypothetical protein